MRQFDVVLRKVAIEVGVTVKSIPLRLYSAVKNKLVLMPHDVWVVVQKVMYPVRVKSILESSSFTPLRTIFERGSSKVVLDSGSKAVSEKNTGASVNTLEMGSKVASYNFTQYRRLGDMDSDGTTPFNLASFDDMSLEDLDYIII